MVMLLEKPIIFKKTSYEKKYICNFCKKVYFIVILILLCYNINIDSIKYFDK